MSSVWRFEWSFAGREEVEVLDPDGVVWTERASFFGGVDEQVRTATLRIELPDMAELVFRHGYDPHTGTGTLYLGDEVAIAGRWSNVQFGRQGDPVEITLGADDAEDRATFPGQATIARYNADPEALDRYLSEFRGFNSNSLRVLAATWSAAQRKATGTTGPWVIGAPGDSDYPGSPAPVVDTTTTPKRLLLHYGPSDVTTGTVWGPKTANSGEADSWDSDSPATAAQDTDAAGNQATTGDFGPGGSAVQYNPDGEYYWSWTGGGPTPRGAGDVCIAMLQTSTVRWDPFAWGSVRARLNVYRVDTYVDEEVSPWEWLKRRVLPMLPMSITLGPRGLEPRLWPWLDEDEVGGFELSDGPGLSMAGPVRYLRWDPEPEVRARYGYDPEARLYRYEATMTALDTAYAQHAITISGKAGGRPLELPTWDADTAHRVAAQRLRMLALQPISIPFMADPAEHGVEGRRPLRIGDPVKLTVSGLSLTDAVGFVGELERSGDRLRISIYLRRDALLD